MWKKDVSLYRFSPPLSSLRYTLESWEDPHESTRLEKVLGQEERELMMIMRRKNKKRNERRRSRRDQ